MIKSTKELKAEYWAMSQEELRELIDRNEGYKNGIFTKLGDLPEKPFHSQLVDLAIACARYDARMEAERAAKMAAVLNRHPRRSRTRISAKSAVA